ncbi:MAG: carbohydrate ABC transporter permease [Firmicutes bacterium]|nr:carbohydrate ABC transporter permease [Bacillota bacterium]
MSMKESNKTDMVFLWACYVLAFLAFVATLYPFIYVLSTSISNPVYIIKQEIWLLPKGFSLQAYKYILDDPMLLLAYYNTLWYTIVGTSINVAMTVLAAYPLSRRDFIIKKFMLIIITITMFFGGGLIPQFINITQLGLYNTRWAVVLPSAVGAWYIFITRTFFNNIPESLYESAVIDGAGHFSIFLKIMLPLSKPILAVLVLFYAVGHWNAWFNAMIYAPNKNIQPVQLYLKRVLIESSNEFVNNMKFIDDFLVGGVGVMQQVKYAMIIVVIGPIICIYPFLQKYFIKGIMIGSIKG